MLLTEKEYNEMWTKDFKMPIHTIPSYHQYLQREVYQQDYLDLFLSRKSETFKRVLICGKWYVDINKSKFLNNLEIENIEFYTIRDKGFYGLLVEYDYPYKEEVKTQREIKYLLIGESPYEKTLPSVGYGMFDNENTYFYNILQTKSTAYFDAPKKAFDVKSNSKSSGLVGLAEKGVVLFDLFPFAIEYNNNIRSAIRNLSLTRFNHILAHIPCNTVCKNLKFSFVCCIGQVGHAEYITDNVNGGRGFVTLCHHRIVINQLSAAHWHVWGGYPRSVLGPLVGSWLELAPPAAGLRFIHKYKSIGKSKSYLPHEVSIRFAFDL